MGAVPYPVETFLHAHASETPVVMVGNVLGNVKDYVYEPYPDLMLSPTESAGTVAGIVLRHWDYEWSQRAYREIRRVLKPRGSFCVWSYDAPAGIAVDKRLMALFCDVTIQDLFLYGTKP